MAPCCITLHYFNARGRAEATRWLLSAAKVKWNDKRYEGEEWKAFQPKAPFGQLPVLEVDGCCLAQSNAINLYLAEEFGFMGCCNHDRAKIAMIGGCLSDTMTCLFKAHSCKDEKEKEKLMKEYSTVALPKFLEFLAKQLGSNNHLVGHKLSLADIGVACFMTEMEKHFCECLKKYPTVCALVKRVTEICEIKQWIAKRPTTNF